MNYVFQWGIVAHALPELFSGVLNTLAIALATIALGIPLSIALASARDSKNAALRGLSMGWVEIGRNTPALFQIYMVYFGLGSLGLRVDSMPALIAGITFNNAGYLAEAFRGAMRVFPETQIRAARSLGMTGPQVFCYIKLPQVMRVVFYPITNQLVWAILMSSLGVVVGLTNDLMGVTQNFNVRTFRTFEFFAVAGAMYYLLAKLVTVSARLLGNRLFRY